MSNTTQSARPTRSITRRLGLLAAAAGILTTSFAVGSGASAQSPDDFGGKFPGVPIPVAPKLPAPTIKLPTIPKNPTLPLPCFNWWCTTPVFQLPDYEASFDPIPAQNGWFEGQKAVPYYVTIRNIGSSNPGAVWSTLASPNGQILGVENVKSWQTDISAQPVSDTARWSAPNVIRFLDDAWVVRDSNGIPTGYAYNDVVYLRVWMAGWNRPELIVSANDHAGVEELGALTPTNYRHTETTRDNNRITFHL